MLQTHPAYGALFKPRVVITARQGRTEFRLSPYLVDPRNLLTAVDGLGHDGTLVVDPRGRVVSLRGHGLGGLSLSTKDSDAQIPGGRGCEMQPWDGRLKHRLLIDAILPLLNSSAVGNATDFFAGSVMRYNELLERPRTLQAIEHVPALADLASVLERRGVLVGDQVEKLLGLESAAAFAYALALLSEGSTMGSAMVDSTKAASADVAEDKGLLRRASSLVRVATKNPSVAAWIKQARLTPEFGVVGRLGDFPSGVISRGESIYRLASFVAATDVDRVRAVGDCADPARGWWLVHSLALRDTRLGYLALRNVEAALGAYDSYFPPNVRQRFVDSNEQLNAFVETVSGTALSRFGLSPVGRHAGLRKLAEVSKLEGKQQRAQEYSVASKQLERMVESLEVAPSQEYDFPVPPSLDDLVVETRYGEQLPVKCVPIYSLGRFAELAQEYDNCFVTYLWGLQSGGIGAYELFVEGRHCGLVSVGADGRCIDHEDSSIVLSSYQSQKFDRSIATQVKDALISRCGPLLLKSVASGDPSELHLLDAPSVNALLLEECRSKVSEVSAESLRALLMSEFLLAAGNPAAYEERMSNVCVAAEKFMELAAKPIERDAAANLAKLEWRLGALNARMYFELDENQNGENASVVAVKRFREGVSDLEKQVRTQWWSEWMNEAQSTIDAIDKVLSGSGTASNTPQVSFVESLTRLHKDLSEHQRKTRLIPSPIEPLRTAAGQGVCGQMNQADSDANLPGTNEGLGF